MFSTTTAQGSSRLTQDLKAEAQLLGFDLVGITPAATPPGYASFLDWLARGYAGEMSYMERRKEAYAHPSGVLPAVKSVVMLGMNYRGVEGRESRVEGQPNSPQPSTLNSQPSAKVAAYAHGGTDYHDFIRERLKRLADFLHERQPGCVTRGVVDTAPLLERDFARLAGLGWFGKNTLLINKRAGSFLFLAGLLTDVIFDYDPPHEKQHCGTCTRCLDACPTDAFPQPGVLDATKCISYLTIELKGTIPEPLREGIGDWLFGCDICQDVCPWNRKAKPTEEPAFQPRPDLSPADAIAVLRMSSKDFDERFRKTPLSRPGRAGLQRNAAIVLGNAGNAAAIPALVEAIQGDEPLVRGAAAWSLGRLEAKSALVERLE
ncbi:MAG: tRNA epoxyqueuosine(34) reductase QueG, partial [Planctomycetota bacterium]|nr:tRNA epoxyqueuosine(34) reductase QueG [Planctomycetota bacterium]